MNAHPEDFDATLKIERFRIGAALALLLAMVLCSSVSTAGDAKSSQSSGLKASIGRISLFNQGAARGLAIQLVLTNVTRNRIYLFVTGDSKAALSDGTTLTLSEVIGLSYCRMLYPPEQAAAFCLKEHGDDLNYYSYLDSDGQVDILMRYNLDGRNPQYTPEGSLSFRLILVSRVAHAAPGSLEAQADPKSTSSPQMIILNFPLTPLSSSND